MVHVFEASGDICFLTGVEMTVFVVLASLTLRFLIVAIGLVFKYVSISFSTVADKSPLWRL